MHTGPKQLIPIANKVIIQYYIEDLRDAGITDIGIILGNVMPEKVQEFLGGGSKLGVTREVKEVKIIAACGSGRRFKISCPVECVRPSDDELARMCSSCNVFVLPSFREG
jgi:NDP-sugar pyrophosphorylase family protein